MIRAVLSGVLCLFAAQSVGQDLRCAQDTFEGLAMTVCEVDASQADLRMFLRDETGVILGQFSSVDRQLSAEGRRLAFAMNAGMYHDDRAPVGLYVENGQQEMRLVPGPGPGNFGLVPNGVFCIREGRADVFETSAFQTEQPQCSFATQSGPMLVIDGALHPRFLKDGTSRYIRNGVGTSADGKRAVFVISDAPVNFHTFGRYFRDVVQVPQALYFDGKVSRLFAPEIGRSDFGFSLGPIVGVAVPAQ